MRAWCGRLTWVHLVCRWEGICSRLVQLRRGCWRCGSLHHSGEKGQAQALRINIRRLHGGNFCKAPASHPFRIKTRCVPRVFCGKDTTYGILERNQRRSKSWPMNSESGILWQFDIRATLLTSLALRLEPQHAWCPIRKHSRMTAVLLAPTNEWIGYVGTLFGFSLCNPLIGAIADWQSMPTSYILTVPSMVPLFIVTSPTTSEQTTRKTRKQISHHDHSPIILFGGFYNSLFVRVGYRFLWWFLGLFLLGDWSALVTGIIQSCKEVLRLYTHKNEKYVCERIQLEWKKNKNWKSSNHQQCRDLPWCFKVLSGCCQSMSKEGNNMSRNNRLRVPYNSSCQLLRVDSDNPIPCARRRLFTKNYW